ncbi:MAG: MFS transporter, partial [Candidatus Aenigmarchaeota archaeon]|nr:MFS transporter [Candidatus Aenigmarchaeota archaeon]
DAIAATTVMMAALSKIEDTLSNSVRGKYAGISLSVEYLGRLFGPVLGGLLADRMFVQAPFLTAAVILLGLLILIPKKNLRKKRISKKELDLVGDIKEFLSYRKLKGMAILGTVMHATFPAFTIFLPLLIVETMGLSYTYAGYAYLALGATHILQFVFGKWADKKAYVFVLLGTLVSGIFTGLVFLSESYIALIFALFFIGLGNSAWNVSAWTLMSDIGEKEGIEGTTIGSYVSIAKIGAFVSFLASGFVVQAWGINALFLVNGVIIVLGSILAYPLLKD